MEEGDEMSVLDLSEEPQLRPLRKAVPERAEDARRQITVSGLVRLNLDNDYYESQLSAVTDVQSKRLTEDCTKSWEWSALTASFRSDEVDDEQAIHSLASRFVSYWRDVRCNRKMKEKATRLVSHKEATVTYWTEERVTELLIVHCEVVALRQQVLEVPVVPRNDADAFKMPLETQIASVFRADGLRLISRELWTRLNGVSKDACTKPEMAYDESAVQCAFLLLRANCEETVNEVIPPMFRVSSEQTTGAYVPIASLYLTSVTAYMIIEIWKLLSWRAYGSYRFDAERKATLAVLNKSYTEKHKQGQGSTGSKRLRDA